jgi:RNA polymerase sigma-70 factor (ECF subfamily)
MRSAFEREALPLMGVLYAGALRLTRNARDAEDLVQDTMVRAFEKFHLYRQGTNLKAWMFRVMMNRFINLYRRRKAAPDRASFEDVGEFLGSTESLRAQDFASAKAMAGLMNDKVFLDSLDDRLKRALESLGEDYRQILILNVIGDMPYKDIAAALDIPIGTVMSRLSRAKSLLRERVAELGREVVPGVGEIPEHAGAA